jgi:hypothetical protein
VSPSVSAVRVASAMLPSHRGGSFRPPTTNRMPSRVAAWQGSGTAADPGVAFQAQVQPGLLKLLCCLAGRVSVPRLTVGDVSDKA